MSVMSAKPACCWHCGKEPLAGEGGSIRFIVICNDCYDGAPDSGNRYDFAEGKTLMAAVALWNEMAEENAP